MSDKETIKSEIIKKYKGIVFKFLEDRVEILFKPHYFYNNNLHNADDFTITECINIIKEFCRTFNIDPSEAKIVNIEFGINVKSPIVIEELIFLIKYHYKNEFQNQKGLQYSKIASSLNKNGQLNRYKQIKCYAKGIQQPQYAHRDTFRYEISSCESKYFKKHLNVETLKDLLFIEPYIKMQGLLLEEFEHILILDPHTKPILSEKEQKDFEEMNDYFF